MGQPGFRSPRRACSCSRSSCRGCRQAGGGEGAGAGRAHVEGRQAAQCRASSLLEPLNRRKPSADAGGSRGSPPPPPPPLLETHSPQSSLPPDSRQAGRAAWPASSPPHSPQAWTPPRPWPRCWRQRAPACRHRQRSGTGCRGGVLQERRDHLHLPTTISECRLGWEEVGAGGLNSVGTQTVEAGCSSCSARRLTAIARAPALLPASRPAACLLAARRARVL